MNPADQKQENDINQGVIRWAITSFIFLLLVAASLFLSAGTIKWPSAWDLVN
jgi:hypothetical protein